MIFREICIRRFKIDETLCLRFLFFEITDLLSSFKKGCRVWCLPFVCWFTFCIAVASESHIICNWDTFIIVCQFVGIISRHDVQIACCVLEWISRFVDSDKRILLLQGCFRFWQLNSLSLSVFDRSTQYISWTSRHIWLQRPAASLIIFRMCLVFLLLGLPICCVWLLMRVRIFPRSSRRIRAGIYWHSKLVIPSRNVLERVAFCKLWIHW